MNLTKNDWATLTRLRSYYLAPESGEIKDYWSSPRDLELYDITFGKRIRWKWENVIRENHEALKTLLEEKSWRILDWGCGTAIASRTLLNEIPTARIDELVLFDRSILAKTWASKKIKEENPQLPVLTSATSDSTKPTLVLISHALGELNSEGIHSLLSTIKNSQAFLWVEPGTKTIAKKLVSLRENLKSDFSFLAPCPHSRSCGLLNEGQQSHWCHHFGKSPDEIFHSSFWSEFSNQLGIDIRTLPISYLIGMKSSVPEKQNLRVIGKARIYKGYAMALCCETSGVSEKRIASNKYPEIVKGLKTPQFSQWLNSKLTT